MSKKMSATKSHLPLHSVSARAGRCTPENAGNKEPSDLCTSLIYGLPQESTWVQLAGSFTSQGRLGTPRCHRLHLIFKLAVARHQRCVDTKDTADIKGASTPKMHDVKENAGNKDPSVASQRQRSSGQVCSRKCQQQEQSDLFTSLIYGFPQESTWMQLAGSCTSQGRLGTTYLSLFSLKRKRKRRIDLLFSLFS